MKKKKKSSGTIRKNFRDHRYIIKIGTERLILGNV